MANDKAQKDFEAHCSEWLDMSKYLKPAQQEYFKAYEAESVSHKKDNAGMRAMNLYLLGQLKLVGAENWRPDKDGKRPKPKVIPRQPMTAEQREQYIPKSSGGYLDKLINQVDESRKAK